jgi:2-polyprenyl-6-methoxyphenol hydroxylase-like FAD-dependent oxidoreductase
VLDEQQMPPAIHRAIFDLYTFCLPEGEQLLGYPVPGRDDDTAVGRRGYNIVWYRPASVSSVADMCTDAAGHYHATGVPPPLIRDEVISRVKADAKAVLAPSIAEIFLRADPFFQPIYDLESPALVFDRVALTGDAAFVARPHVGAGATKAAIDAAVLAAALRGAGNDLPGALARFESSQLPFGRDLVALSRQQGAYLSAQLSSRDRREENRDIEALLHAHGTRSDQIGAMVTGRGLDAYL